MIKEFKLIVNYGVFRNYTPTNLSFLKFNLFYGWNGSGKTTLSKVFSSLDGESHEDFPEGNFKVKIGESFFEKDDIQSSSLQIKVFNQDFVKRNLDFENLKAKSILFLSSEKIEEKNKLLKKSEELNGLIVLNKKNIIELDAKYKELTGLYSKTAKNIKSSFGLIQTSNSRFLNYDRRKLESFIEAESKLITKSNILSAEELVKVKLSTSSSVKDALTKKNCAIETTNFNTLLQSCKKLIVKNVISKKISSLAESTIANKWVEDGIKLHNGGKECIFCEGVISNERIENLNNHFSKEYQITIDELNETLALITQTEQEFRIEIYETADFYEELQVEIKALKNDIEKIALKFQEYLARIKQLLNQKKLNPFNILMWESYHLNEELSSLLVLFGNLNEVIEKHNSKTHNYQKVVDLANDQLELHFVCQQLVDGKLFSLKKKIEILASEHDKNLIKEQVLREEVEKIRNLLVNVAIASASFNTEIEKFLGRKEIKLIFQPEFGGYLIFRGEQSSPAKNLSEGEKTAIAFIYFITKLNESGNDIKNTVVVLDDPISSFDSNHLHHSFAFIKSHLGECAQLNILTHNFEFFKMIRDWFKKKNDMKKQIFKSSFYFIKASSVHPRQSTIESLPKELLSFESEYHLLFGRLLEFRAENSLKFEDAHFVANSARKVLEAFLAFKYPGHRSDFANLLEKACSDDKVLFHKLYNFLNKFSHSKNLDIFDIGSESIITESGNIINEVFGLLEKLDEGHYREMEKLLRISSTG